MLKKRWKIKNTNDDYTVRSLADSLNISVVLARLLVQRGIKTFAQARTFFRPSLESLHDPFLMDGMEQATLRVISAITENQQICIFGDYDVDGTCATAILYMFLKDLGANVDFYIPQRLTEGYGLSNEAINQVHQLGTKLLISVDCGITAVEETDYANSLGLDVIICDHHQPKEKIPNALAVLDPLKPGCKYPFGYLSGAGIAFKLAQGISDRIGKRELPLKYLDLVALAGAADIVPLSDENRVLVREGLNLINSNPRPGIEALIESSSINPGNITSGQVVFTLAPRINAVGRLGDAKRAVELLITDDKQRALQLADILETENYQRRKIDVETFESAIQLVESSVDLDKDTAIILHQEGWHPGVIGIVASRIVERYYRPTILLTTVDGLAKGSARSIADFNVYEALKRCEDLLVHFGGHQAAAGLAVELDKIEEFRTRFNLVAEEILTEESLQPEIDIDSRIKFSEITPKFFRILDLFAPFGPENLRPVFLSENVMLNGTPRIVGKNHLVFSAKQDGNRNILDCIGFNMGNYLEIINNKDSNFDIVFSIDTLERDGRIYPQLKIKDLKPSKN